jgi:hypothetical protein
MNKDTMKAKLIIFLRQVPPALLLDGSPRKISKDLWWTNQEFSPVDITPPWYPMLMYHLVDEY